MPDAPGMPPPGGPAQFSNRTDQGPGQPIRVPTGLPYGSAKQIEQAQQAVPLPAVPGGAPPPSLGAGPVPQQGGPTGLPLPPNSLELLSHPTQRPQEPVTAPSSIRGGPKVIPQTTILAAMEDLMARSDSVPENVMRLYQQLRMEAAQQPQF